MAWRPERIISGGQSGADMGGLLAAQKRRMHRTANVFPGFKPLNDDRARLIDLCGYDEVKDVVKAGLSYIESLHKRTKFNVIHSDATAIFVRHNLETTRGSKLTRELCQRHAKPSIVILEAQEDAVDLLKVFLDQQTPKILNVAGERYCDQSLVADIIYRALEW